MIPIDNLRTRFLYATSVYELEKIIGIWIYHNSKDAQSIVVNSIQIVINPDPTRAFKYVAIIMFSDPKHEEWFDASLEN